MNTHKRTSSLFPVCADDWNFQTKQAWKGGQSSKGGGGGGFCQRIPNYVLYKIFENMPVHMQLHCIYHVLNVNSSLCVSSSSHCYCLSVATMKWSGLISRWGAQQVSINIITIMTYVYNNSNNLWQSGPLKPFHDQNYRFSFFFSVNSKSMFNVSITCYHTHLNKCPLLLYVSRNPDNLGLWSCFLTKITTSLSFFSINSKSSSMVQVQVNALTSTTVHYYYIYNSKTFFTIWASEAVSRPKLPFQSLFLHQFQVLFSVSSTG